MPRVTGMDVMMLSGETAAWHMHVCALTFLDPSTAPGGFDPAQVRELFAERMAMAPQFRWGLHRVALGLDQPVLADDERFDVKRHFRHAVVPAPGGPEELAKLLARLMERKLDRTRPLWEIWMIEGLADGRLAVLTKIHHSIIDGTSGADLASLLMDVSPVPAPREPPPPAAAEPAPSLISGLSRAATRTLTSPLRVARYSVQLAQQAEVVARHLLRGTAAGMPFVAGRSPLNGALTSRRSVAFSSVPLADVLRAKEAFGVTVNDIVLALVADALRSWLIDRGELPGRSLVAEMPVSTRTAASRHEVRTQVANTFVSLATDVADPVERLTAIHRSAHDAKAMQRDLAARKSINLSDLPSPILLGVAVNAFTVSGMEGLIPPIFSLIMSNVNGPRMDLYMAGAKVVGIHPFGPLLFGSGLNITALSLGDRVNFGLTACPDLVGDPWDIADRLPAGLTTLLRRRPRHRPTSRTKKPRPAPPISIEVA